MHNDRCVCSEKHLTACIMTDVCRIEKDARGCVYNTFSMTIIMGLSTSTFQMFAIINLVLFVYCHPRLLGLATCLMIYIYGIC